MINFYQRLGSSASAISFYDFSMSSYFFTFSRATHLYHMSPCRMFKSKPSRSLNLIFPYPVLSAKDKSGGNSVRP